MRKYLPLLLLVLLALGACGKKQQRQSTPLAQVNDEVLTLEDFRSTFTEEQWSSLSEEQKKKEIDDWVNLTILAQEADLQELGEQPAIQQRIDYAAKKIKANALIARRLSGIQVSDDALFNYYRVHRADFQSKMMEYYVQRIFVGEGNLAEALLKQINAGLDFDTAVSEYSREPLKSKLGRMGFVTADSADSLFWRAAHALEPGIPGILNTAEGTYILRYTEQREGTQEANFEEYRAEIRNLLLRDRQIEIYDDLVRELKAKTPKVYYY